MVFFIDLPLDAIWLSLYRLFDVFFLLYPRCLPFSLPFCRGVYVQFIRSHGFVCTEKSKVTFAQANWYTHTQTHWHWHLFVILAPNSTSTLSLWLLRARVYVCVNSNTLLFIILALLLRNIVTYHCRLHNTCRECVCKRFFSPACSFIHSPMFFCSLSFLPTAS